MTASQEHRLRDVRRTLARRRLQKRRAKQQQERIPSTQDEGR